MRRDIPDLLVPFDGSEAAERVLRYACRSARRDDARLIVLCVAMLPVGVEPDQVTPEIDDTPLLVMVRAQEICREERVTATFELSHARNLAAAIVNEAAQTGAEVICLALEPDEEGQTALMSKTV